MNIDFSKLFHQTSKDHHAATVVPMSSNSDEWPIEWKTTFYKTYASMGQIALSDEAPLADLFETIRRRISKRDFSRRAVSLREISTILKYSCGIVRSHPRVARAQASGGARFPIEVYPFVFTGTREVPAGLYHYNVKDHALDVLWQRPFTDEQIAELFTYPWIQRASMVFVMTAVFERNQMKYGMRGYRYVLLEAGHIGQNMYLNAAALGAKCCALGGTRDENLEQFLDIDGNTESVVYAVALG